MKTRFALLILFIMFADSSYSSPTNADSTLKKLMFKSKVLNEDRIAYINLPDNYEKSNTKYPVLYLLDGLANYRSVLTSVRLLSDEGFIPQMIIVCVENTDRNRDMSPTHSMKNYFGDNRDYYSSSGNAKTFLDFMKKELTKKIDSIYRTSNFRILSGHSMTALATTFALLDTSRVFNGFIAVDPSLWWDNGSINDLTRQFFINNKFKTDKIFFLGTTVSGQIQKKQLDRYLALTDSLKINKLDFHQVVYSTDNHMTIPLKCNYDGLQFIYKDWHISYDVIKKGRSDFERFIKSIKEMYDYDIEFDENYLTNQGFDFIDNEQLDKAIQTLKLNLEYFPKSVRSNFLIAEAYRFNGDDLNALAYYKKVIELEPNNTIAINGIKNIEKK